jgi:hypothetical protein
MLPQRITQQPPSAGMVERRVGERADRAMGVLQYGIALLAIGGAVLLAALR